MTRILFLPAIITLLSAILPAVADTHAPVIDWVPYSELSLEQQANRAPYCSGQFVAPVWEGISLNPNGQTDVMVLKATQLSQSSDSQWSATGHAELTYRDVLLGADRINFDQNLSSSQLSKNVIIRVPQVAIAGSDAEMNIQNKTGQVANGFYVIHDTGFSGRADEIAMEANGYFLADASLTRCDPTNPAWHIQAASLRIYNDKGIAVAKHARINIGPVPIVYTPYLSIPIDDKRHSGFLSPALDIKIDGNEWRLNTFSVPFYWNIAPQIDNTVTPLYQDAHDWYVDNETRYLTDSMQGLLNLGWNPSESRWMVAWDHEQSLAWESTLTIDWQYTSDRSIPVDFKGADDYATYDYQGITLEKSVLHSDWTLTAERWQPVDLTLASNKRPYAKQPGVNISGGYLFHPLMATQWEFDLTQYSRNLSDAESLTLNPVNGETSEGLRAAASVIWSAPIDVMDWRLTPNARVSLAQYSLSTPGSGRPESTSWTQPTAWLTADKSSPTKQFAFGLERSATHRFQWLYSPYQAQYDAPLFDTTALEFDKTALFATRRFSGMDRAGDMNRLSASITNRFIHTDSGQQVTTGLAQTIRLTPERLGLESDATIATQSEATPVYASLLWEPNAAVDIQADVDWNVQYQHQQRVAFDAGLTQKTLDYRAHFEREWSLPTQAVNKETAKLSFSNSTNQRIAVEDVKILTAGQWQEDILVSGFTPIAQRWGLSASIDYDVTADELTDSLLGIEYDSCCWNLRLLTKINWLSINDTLPFNSLFIEFSLKGLGQNNSKVESLLSQHIDGYNGRIYR